jgi:uncharacterized cupredoxin-like copper-binding protein
VHRFGPTLLALVIAAAVAACGSSASTASSQPSAAATASSQPSNDPAASPSESAAVSASPLGSQAVSLTEFKVDVASTLKSGKTDFTIANKGDVPHELLVFKSDLDPAAYPTDAAGDIKEDGAGVNLLSDGENIDPGGAQARSVDLAPGTYVFVCNIAGHFKQGMFTIVTVTP